MLRTVIFTVLAILAVADFASHAVSARETARTPIAGVIAPATASAH